MTTLTMFIIIASVLVVLFTLGLCRAAADVRDVPDDDGFGGNDGG